MHAHGSIGRTGVDVHHDSLPATRDSGKTGRHVDGHVFMGYQHHLRMCPALLVPACQFFNDGDVVGAEVGKDMLDAELGQAFEEVVRAAALLSLAHVFVSK